MDLSLSVIVQFDFVLFWGLAVCLGVAKGKLLESFGKIKSI